MIDEVLPTAKLTPNDGSTTYKQPTDSLKDYSAYSEAGLVLTVQNMVINSGTIKVYIDTAIDNIDELFFEHTELQTYTSAPSYPAVDFAYFAGASGLASPPGFCSYLRVRVDLADATNSITMGVKGVFK